MGKAIDQIIKALYNNYADFEEVTYDNVDGFYSYLGYELEISQVLSSIGVNGTSDLLDLLESAE